jgi:hypothetical protein
MVAMELKPEVRKCANPECNAAFRKLGEGTLTVLSVEEPGQVGLPPNIKQKAVWLCGKCAEHMYVHYDRQHHRIRIMDTRHRRHHQVA